MIKKFDEYINELWSKGIHRSVDGKKRLESGREVMTAMGIKIFLENPSMNYEDMIEYLCDNDSNDSVVSISFYRINDHLDSYTYGGDYVFPISDDYVAVFPTYEDVCDYDDDDGLDEFPLYSVNDYKSIISGIAQKISTFGERFDYIGYDDYRGDVFGFLLVDFNDDEYHDVELDEANMDKIYDNFVMSWKKKFNSKKNMFSNEDFKIYLDFGYLSMNELDEIIKFSDEYFSKLTF